jgi:hypothetical protein
MHPKDAELTGGMDYKQLSDGIENRYICNGRLTRVSFMDAEVASDCGEGF